MNKQLHRLKDENGQSLILVVLALPVLLALTLLVVDGANLFVQRRSIQNAADAAALAVANRQLDPYGGGCLPSDPVDPQSGCKTTLVNYSNRNAGPRAPNLTNSDTCGGITNTDTNCYTIETPYKGSATRVKVTLTKRVSTFFGGVASLFDGAPGVSSFNVSASAVTGLSNAVAAGNVVPIGISLSHAPTFPCSNDPSCCPITPGCVPFNKDVTFDFDADPAGFTVLDLSIHSTSAPAYCGDPGTPSCRATNILSDWISNGYSNPDTGVREQLPANAWYAHNNGNKNGLKQGLSDAQAAGTVLLIPVFDTSAMSGTSTSYHVIGFAAFVIDKPPPTDGLPGWNNSGHVLIGQFKTFISSGVGCTDPATCGQSFGVFVATVFE